MNEKETGMKKVQELCFALVELGLYLDSHPDCREALKAYKELNGRYEDAKKDYEEKFGPIAPGGGGNVDYWDWVATPFPWEL